MEIVSRERPPPTRGHVMSISVAKLPPPPTMKAPIPPPSQQPPPPPPPIRLLSTTNTPGGSATSDSAAITRCDLMWSGSNNSTGEAFTPVESCEIHPYVIIRDKENHGHDDDDHDGLRNTGIKMHYRWMRGPARAVCFFHPHRPASSQCTITLRCFCSFHCFDRGHKQLRRFYASQGKWCLPRQPNEFSYGVPCKQAPVNDMDAMRDADISHYRLLRQAGLVVPARQNAWQVISYNRNFTPHKTDVGHQLKFECCLVHEPSSSEALPTPMTNNKPPPLGGLVRVVTSAHDPTSLASSISHSEQPSRPLNATGPRSSPVVSTSAGDRKLSLGTPNGMIEENFWRDQDLKRTSDNATDTYRSVITCCVVPQTLQSEPREIVPVGLLSLFASPPSVQTPQRIIPANSPLARALGIGLLTSRRARMQQPNPLAYLNDPYSRLPGHFANSKGSPMPSIMERRETLLTDSAFSQWYRAPPNPTPPPTAKLPANNGLKSKPLPQNRSFKTYHTVLPRELPPNTADQARGGRGVKGGSGSSSTESGPTPDSFTVMTWNVLADIYASVDAYPYCEPYVLAWPYRRDRLLHEILSYSPDIICLQEVQADHFEDFFAPALLRRGYEGLYKHKTSRVFRGSGKHRGGKFVCDGCATFYKIPKFRLIDHFGIEFARVSPPCARAFDNKSDKRLNKDNVALVMYLEYIMINATNGPNNGNAGHGNPKMPNVTATSRRLVVANTHILANTEAPDVKIWQANTLTTVLTDYMEKSTVFNRTETASGAPGLVICGDFNSTPDGAVYQLMTGGICDSRHEELQSSDIYKWLHDITLAHGLNLRSSYGAANFMRLEAEKALTHGTTPAQQTNQQHPYVLSHAAFEPEFTNYTHQYVGCLDYIFFDDRHIKVTGTLDVLKELTLLEEAQALQLSDWALPSPQRPSDHTPLLTRFEWMR